MLGLARSISNRTGTLVSSEVVVEDTVYNLGEPGESDGSIIYAMSSDTAYEVGPDSFLHLSAGSYDANTTFSDLQTEVGAAQYVPTYTDWEIIPAEAEFNLNGYLNGALFPNNDVLSIAVENYMIANFFGSYSLTAPNVFAVISDISNASNNFSEDPYVCIAFQLGTSPNDFFLLKKQIDPAVGYLSGLTNSSGWTIQVVTGQSIGSLIHAKNSETDEYLNYLVLAIHRGNVLDAPQALMSVPQTPINVYSEDTLIPNGIDFNVLSAFGDILEPNRLVETAIDRYVYSESIKGKADYTNNIVPTGDDSALAIINDGNTQTIPSVSVLNKQIVVKVIFASTVKPPDPWYDKLNGEVIKAKINVIGLRNSAASEDFLLALTVTNLNNALESTAVNSVTQQFTIAGTPTYFAIHTFKFDVSDVPVYTTDQEKTNFGISGTAKVSDLSYDGVGSYADDKHEAQIFKINQISFGSNKRTYTASIQGNKTFNQVIVPTFNLPSTPVGYDSSLLIMDSIPAPSGTVMSTSTKSGYTPPLSGNNIFLWEFDSSRTSDLSISTKNFVHDLEFDYRSGALNENSVFVYINSSDQQTQISGDLSLSIDKSLYPYDFNIALDLKIQLDGVNYSTDATPTVTSVGDVDTYNWVFSKDFNMQGGGALYAVKQTLKLVANVVNGSRADGDYDITLLNGSTFSGAEVSPQGSPVETPEEDLSGQTIRLLPRYNKY